jgi:hypothetical protein
VFGDGYFSGNPFIKSEYAEYSIEEYLLTEGITNKMSLKDILV